MVATVDSVEISRLLGDLGLVEGSSLADAFVGLESMDESTVVLRLVCESVEEPLPGAESIDDSGNDEAEDDKGSATKPCSTASASTGVPHSDSSLLEAATAVSS